jgi:hypothetical protein
MMKFRFAWLICVAILWLSFTKADAQPYRILTVDDFQGVPDTHNGENVAFTNCNIEFSYTAHKEKNYYRLDFSILVVMDHEKSWLDRNKAPSREYLAEILKHEQGHYNMAYLEQQELLRTVSHTVFYADYQKVANNIFNRIDAKYQQLNRDYDDDTEHMINRPQQHSWDMYFKKALGTEYIARD